MHAVPFFAPSSLLALACLCASPAFAAPPGADGDAAESSWGLGIGAASSQKAYRGMDRDNIALPLLQFENQYVKVFGPGVEVKLPGLRLSDTQKLSFGLLGKYDFGGYEAKDSPYLAGMAERKGGFWAGAKVEWETRLANVTAEFAGATGNSKGRVFSLGVDRTWQVGERVMITPRVVATWQDRKYVDYYYGVRASEVRAGRAAYRGDSGMNTELGLRAMYMLDPRHSLFLDVGATRLSSSIKNSPLVDRSSESHVFLGYVYRFQ